MKNTLKMKNLAKGILALSAVLLTGISCSDEYLDVKPEGVLTIDSGYFQGENIISAVNASYKQMLEWPQHSFAYSGIFSIASDDAYKGSDPGDTGADKHKLDDFTHDATDASVSDYWGANYKGIAIANSGMNIINDPVNGLDDAEKPALIGEFRFFRAYHYFCLARVFGGVPLVDENTDPTDNQTLLTRKSIQETYDFLIADLQFAAENLPQTQPQVGRVTKGTALTLLAKAYFYLKDYNQVLNYTNQVIASGQYSLHSNYAELWRIQNENTQESIFEVQGSASANLGVNNMAVHHGVRGQFGWGFDIPSDELVAAFEEAGDEVRKNATVLMAGETMYDGVQISADPPNPRYSEKMYWGDQAANATEKNLIVLRYGEVLLMNAEANNELGNTAEAANKINMLRNRVELDDLPSLDQSQMRMAIYKERRLELAMEYDRYFELVREGRAAEVMGPLGYVAGKHEHFPIPQSQIDLSGGLLTQNPGY